MAGPGGAWLASAGADSTVRTWDPAAGTPRGYFTGHAGGVRVLSADPAGRWLASGGADGTVRLWDPTAQAPCSGPARSPVTALAAAPAAQWFAYTLGGDGKITLRDASAQAERNISTSYEPHPRGAVLAMAADPRGTWLASAGRDGAISIWDPHDGSARFRLVGRQSKAAKEAPTLMVPSSDGRWLACSAGSPKVRIWSPVTGRQLNTLWAAGGEVKAVIIDPAGTWLASCGQDSTVRLWNLEDGSRAVMQVPAADRRLAASPDGTWFASAGGDQAIRIWDPGDGARRSVLTGHDAPPAALATDPTGRYLCSVAADATIRIWEPSRGHAVTSSRVDGALHRLCWIGENLIAAGIRGVYQYQLGNPA